MGREVKRVPLDFDWPLNKPWKGYINPHYKKCEVCNGNGDTIARRRLSDLVSWLMLSTSDATRGECHPFLVQALLYQTQGMVCSEDILELTIGLAEREPSGFGHDALDKWRAERKIIEAAGLEAESWGICKACGGEGIASEARAAYEAWEREDPPTGDGYQIWETVSEGSPISPPFDSPERLAKYMAGKQWGADKGTDYETWLAFIKGPGWSVSMVCDEKGLRTGVQTSIDRHQIDQ